MKDSEELIDELMESSFDKGFEVSANRISKRIRKRLKDQNMIQDSQKWMIQSLLRHVQSKILRELKRALEEELKTAGREIKGEFEEIIQSHLQNKMQYQPPVKQGTNQTSSSASTEESSTKKIAELEDELERYRRKVIQLNNYLDRIFNTLLNVYPNLQALPVITRTGKITITRLCRVLDKRKEEIMPFLQKMEENGVIKIDGDQVKSIKPLFKRE